MSEHEVNGPINEKAWAERENEYADKPSILSDEAIDRIVKWAVSDDEKIPPRRKLSPGKKHNSGDPYKDAEMIYRDCIEELLAELIPIRKQLEEMGAIAECLKYDYDTVRILLGDDEHAALFDKMKDSIKELEGENMKLLDACRIGRQLPGGSDSTPPSHSVTNPAAGRHFEFCDWPKLEREADDGKDLNDWPIGGEPMGWPDVDEGD